MMTVFLSVLPFSASMQECFQTLEAAQSKSLPSKQLELFLNLGQVGKSSRLALSRPACQGCSVEYASSDAEGKGVNEVKPEQ